MKRVILLLLVTVLLTGCGSKAATASMQSAQMVPETTAAPTIEAIATQETQAPKDPIQALMDTMTLSEKVGQLFVARCPEENAAEDAAQYQLGGYILFDRDFSFRTVDEVLAQVESYQQGAKIPMIIGVDEEGGTVVRASAYFILREEKFQSPQELYAQGGMQRILEDTVEKDALLSSMGINVNFAPVADVSTDPDDFIYDRSLGQDAKTTADYTAQVVAQMTADGMGSVLKHFPGYGSNVDTHNGIAIDERPLDTFLTYDLLPFASYTAGNGATAIMMSHNIVTCFDGEMPVSLSSEAHRFLREEFGYDGVVMTDALDMGAVKAYAEGGNIAVTALQAGNDILLICDYATGIPAILAAVEDGTLTEDMIDAACYRVLSWKQALGLI